MTVFKTLAKGKYENGIGIENEKDVGDKWTHCILCFYYFCMFRKTIVEFHIKLQLNCRFVSAYGRLKPIVCSHEKSKRKDGLESEKEQEQGKRG